MRSKSAKVAISLPKDTLEAIERERKVKGESRSKFFRRALERFLKEECASSAVNNYVRGYQEVPESAEEVEAAHRLGSTVLTQEPWE